MEGSGYMDKGNVVRFLEALGCQDIKSSPGSLWVKAECPLAQWFHEGSAQKRPFAVKAAEANDDPVGYHCYLCGLSGTLPRLLHNLQWLTMAHYEEASGLLSSIPAVYEGDLPKRKRIVVSKDHFSWLTRKREGVPEAVLNQCPLVSETNSEAAETIKRWLSGFKISMQLIAKYKLRIYVDADLREVGVVFPAYSKEGDVALDMFVQMVGNDHRLLSLNKDLQNSSVDPKREYPWFGRQFYKETRPLVLVNHPLDVLRLRSLGIENVWAYLGHHLTRAEFTAVDARVVYVGFENNYSGRKLTKRALRVLKAPSVFLLRWDMAGTRAARYLENQNQFRRVFDSRIKIVP
jgi:hypothetical protein